MMRTQTLVAIPCLLGPGAAAAHPGHLAELAGHGHWVAGAAIGAAIAIGLWAGLRGRGKDASDGAAPEPGSEVDGEDAAAETA